MKTTYYVKRSSHSLLELRQTRFKALSTEHPHDVCAIARNREELQGMYDKYLAGGIDWREFEASAIKQEAAK